MLSEGVVDCTNWIARHEISRRELQRDLSKLREIGQGLGFTVTHSQRGRVFLHVTRAAIRIGEERREDLATLGRVASALPGPVEHEIRRAVGGLPSDAADGFLHLRETIPAQSERAAAIFSQLKEAASHHARVIFTYTTRGVTAERRVEPYHVIERTGRYYLIAYDLVRRDWRQFGLDAIGGPLRKDGTFSPRSVPARYLAKRSVGWIGPRRAGSDGRRAEVVFHLGPGVAASITSRTWQEEQRAETFADGSAEIALRFDDLAEAVRWSMSFAPDATIVAPAEAATLAVVTLAILRNAYVPTATHVWRDPMLDLAKQ
ncbi:MAG: helix-turn-helix transcriptional regulator [Candidatus Tyrphobacter sp.]